MYLKTVQIDNYGAIKKLNIEFPFNEDGSPKPLILVGKNGSGKTLLTSSIVDSLIEIKRSEYNSLMEVKEGSYYKAGKKDYIHDGEIYSFIRVVFDLNNDNRILYNDLASHDPNQTMTLLQHYNLNLGNEFINNGFSKSIEGETKNIFSKHAILYFPVNRYYNPAWLVDRTDPRIEAIEKYVGKNTDNFIKMNVINSIESWILDVILDSEIYEKQTISAQPYILIGDNDYRPVNGASLILRKEGKNTKIQSLINKILTTILKSKIPDLEFARFGIGNKESGRKISVIIRKEGSTNDVTISPTFSHMSSGEAMLVALFCSIVKNFDSVSDSESLNLSEITGIVIIDEIDLNLHIEYAKKAVPELLSLFPKVQFIITSHSPFFLLGMKDVFSSNYQIISTPGGEIIEENDFEELQTAYSIFIERFEDIRENLNSLKDELYDSTKTLVITEGKTDWKHMKAALEHFQVKGEFTDLDFIFHEYEDASFSDDKLNNFLTNVAQVSNNKKIIGVFDRDEGNGKKYSKKRINSLGNNVYAITIPQPEHRSYHAGICIEFMYKDVDLFRINGDSRRIYVSSEFNDNGRLISDPQVGVQNYNKIKGKNSQDNDNIIDSEVIDISGKSLAMSKNDFANSIINKDENFKEIDFSPFRDLFLILSEVIKS